MQTLSALLLSASLVLGAAALRTGDSEAANKLDSYLGRLVQAAVQLETNARTSVPTPAPVKNVATVKSAAPLYSSYSQTTKILAQLQAGDQIYILRKPQISSDEWVYATAEDYHVSGWVLVSALNMPAIREDADLQRTGSDEYVPSYAKMGIVSTDQLNIRTAPGTGFDRVGCYRSGDRVGIIETNSGWGRTAKGWIYLGYVYMDGQVGNNPMVGNVNTELLNVRSGPGLSYPVCGSQRLGDRLLILEQVYAEGYYWGCTRQGWLCMRYVSPDYIPGTKAPIYGYGITMVESVKVFPTPSANQDSIGMLDKGALVPILQAQTVGEKLWGQTNVGWIRLTNVDMKAIYAQAITPPLPEQVSINVTPIPTEPPATEPPATEPPATEPPATEPPATEPPTTEPPATEPPATEPPATEPPATEPPATEPPATEPPAAEPPAEAAAVSE